MKQKYLLLLIFGLFISGISFSQKTLYVANNGSDSNPGTISSPLKNIQTAINKMASGDIVYLRGGVYREMITVNKTNTKILAYPGETPILKGSDIKTGWVADGDYWKLPTKLINVQQVFVDGNNPLQQIGYPRKSFETGDPSRKRYEMPVGTGIGDMVAGRFWWDGNKGDNDATGYLYIWLKDSSDPNSHTIEVSQRKSILLFNGRGSYVKGVQFEHSNSNTFSEQGTAISLRHMSAMDSCVVQWCDFSGVGLGNKAQVINSTIVYNGAVGISSSGGDDFLIKNTRMAYNNYRNFYSQWHTGGFKGATHAWGTIENCEIDNNNGPGVWFDYCFKSAREDDFDGENLYPIIIRNNYFHNNGTGTYNTKTINNNATILIEVSEQAFVYNNIIDTFEYRGIWVSSAWFSYFTNNILTNGKSGYNYSHAIDGGASYVDWAWVKDNVIANNILYNNNTGSDIRMTPEDGTKYVNNICRNNLIYRKGGPLKLKYGSSTKKSIE
ncbi:MAG: right-handed parallel beta-helix repeat-containing protein, partial [Draconibacterium sp.]|nr:right-handed parallel beta-helix repeat-containing protein [Draconibacterium sp.]